MKCGRVRRKMMAYHDGELGLDVKGRIEKHLEVCEGCTDLLRALERGDHATGAADTHDPGSEYWNEFTGRVMDRIRQEVLTKNHGPQRAPLHSGFSPARLAPALSIALVAVVAVGVMMKIRQPVIPDHAASRRDKLVGKEIPLSPEKQTPTRLNENEVFYHSKLDEAAPTMEPEVIGSRQEVKRVPPETKTVISAGKTEEAAGEDLGVDGLVEETGKGLRDRDGSTITASPYPPDEEAIRSTLEPAAPAVSRKERTYIDTGAPPLPEGAIDDGSWGQLAFARMLEKEGRLSESETILDDLLERSTEPSIQEQASLLLVSVLANQNRLPEARKVLKGAQEKYPANLMIQNYILEGGPERNNR
jgi:hypothetical protein